jgi:tetratricopeptide (TPR) repeat protein
LNDTANGPRASRAEIAWLGVVCVALLAIYLPGLGNSLVFDDSYLAEGLFRDYASPLDVRARWLSYGSFVWLQSLAGDGWWKQRLANLAIHMGVVVALWALYREILRHIQAPGGAAGPPAGYERSPALALAIGAFALNPVAVYSVAYLVQRSILLATFFVVLALWLFARGMSQRRPWLHACALASYAAAIVSKEHAILAPLAALPLYIVVARPSGRRLALVAGAGATAVAIAALALYARYGEILGKPFDEYSRVYLAQLARLNPDAPRLAFPLSIENQAWLFFQYGLRWFLPFEAWMSINLRPPFPVALASFPQVLGIVGYAAAVVGGFWAVVRYRDWRALLGLSLLFPALLFATEFATVWVQDPFVLYRSYLWAIGVPGIVFFAVHGASWKLAAAIGAVLGALLGWQAFDRVSSLATPERAWTDAIEKLPADPRAVGRWFPYLNRGSDYVDRNQFGLAVKDFEMSATLGDMGMGTFNIGSVLAAAGRHEQAMRAFASAEKQGYDLYNLPFQRGLSLMALGHPVEARAQFERARALDPPSPAREIVLLQLGRTALQLGRPDDALPPLRAFLDRDPGSKEGRYLLGMALVARGEHAAALPILAKLVDEDHGGIAYYGRALAHQGLGHKAEALADIDTAIRIGPDNPALHELRAKIRAMREP